MDICQTKPSLRTLLGRAGAAFDPARVPDADVTAVVCDSRKVVPGCVFIAIRGTGSDGHAYAEQVLAAGAVCVVTETVGFLPGRPVAAVGNAREAFARLNHHLWGEPSKRMKTLAVTGTNGKTTSAYLASHVLSRKHRPIK